MKRVVKVVGKVSSIAWMLAELGAGTGMVLLGLRQISIVVDEHDFLKPW